MHTRSPAARAALIACLTTSLTPLPEHAPAQQGALLLSGGEFIHPEIRAKFVELSGGPSRRFLYVPTASSGIRLPSGFEYEPASADTANPRTMQFELELAALFGVEHVTVLHTRNRDTANSDEFVRRIREANGVWLSGGNAGRLADAYLDTRVQRELEALLKRGGVIGGNSAGAIIQGSFIIRGRPDKPVLMAEGRTRGFGFLPNVAINPHLMSQKRENELVTVVDAHPELLGLGIPTPPESSSAITRSSRWVMAASPFTTTKNTGAAGTTSSSRANSSTSPPGKWEQLPVRQ